MKRSPLRRSSAPMKRTALARVSSRQRKRQASLSIAAYALNVPAVVVTCNGKTAQALELRHTIENCEAPADRMSKATFWRLADDVIEISTRTRREQQWRVLSLEASHDQLLPSNRHRSYPSMVGSIWLMGSRQSIAGVVGLGMPVARFHGILGDAVRDD